MNGCPYFDICSGFRKEAEELFKEKGICTAGRTTCYNPGWLLKNGKKCENYHPELRQLPKKITKIKKTDDYYRKDAEKQIVKKITVIGTIERCVTSGITARPKILAELIKVFPDVEKNRLRDRINCTVKYLKEKGRI